MENYTIGITTFPRRFEHFKTLITTIRSYTNAEIIVQVNQFNKIKDEQYRKDVMLFCSSVNNLYLTVYPEFTSLAKMWNTIIINSSNENVLMLNDDMIITQNIFKIVETIVGNYNGLCVLNNSWSHFIISKHMLDELNYFDERLLAYGEEDGDMVWRYYEKFKTPHVVVYTPGIQNIGEGYGIVPPNLKWFNAGNVIRPEFNRDFCFNKKYTPNKYGYRGMFDAERMKILPDLRQYPYESFKLNNKDLL